MKNLILNVDGSGVWQELPDVPRNVTAIKIRGRSADVLYRYAGQTNYFSILSTDQPHVLTGKFNTGDIEINSAGTVEIEFSTRSNSTFN